VIDPDVVTLLESGSATFVGSVDAAGNPAAAYGMGALVLGDGAELRVILGAEERQVIENLQETGAVAVGATDVPTLRSVQIKGRAQLVEPVTPEDRIRINRYIAEYFDTINRTDGTPVELLHRLVPRDFVAFVMTIEEIFDQTPGPQAGSVLSRS
jgi:hypothetical protein